MRASTSYRPGPATQAPSRGTKRARPPTTVRPPARSCTAGATESVEEGEASKEQPVTVLLPEVARERQGRGRRIAA